MSNSNDGNSSSTFDLPDTSPAVKVTLTPDLSRDDLLSFPAFKTWISTLKRSLALQREQEGHAFHKAPYTLRSIQVQSVDRFGKGRLGFVKLKAEVSNDEGETLPGSVFLRGGSVAMLLTLQPDDIPANSETDKHVILTIQPRIPAGSLSFLEIPAGMLDSSGTFAGAAMSEIREETGLEVKEDELTDLSRLALSGSTSPGPGSSGSPGADRRSGGEPLQAATYPSAGGSDEYVPVLLAQKRVPRAELDGWRGRLTGLRSEGEKITLTLCRLEELWRVGVRDAKAMAAWALYSGLKAEGRI